MRTLEPLPSETCAPSAINKASMSAHLIDAETGFLKIATAENDRVTKPLLMPGEPRYLQRLVRPGSVG